MFHDCRSMFAFANFFICSQFDHKLIANWLIIIDMWTVRERRTQKCFKAIEMAANHFLSLSVCSFQFAAQGRLAQKWNRNWLLLFHLIERNFHWQFETIELIQPIDEIHYGMNVPTVLFNGRRKEWQIDQKSNDKSEKVKGNDFTCQIGIVSIFIVFFGFFFRWIANSEFVSVDRILCNNVICEKFMKTIYTVCWLSFCKERLSRFLVRYSDQWSHNRCKIWIFFFISFVSFAAQICAN